MSRSCTKLGNDFRKEFNYYGKLTKECMGQELWNEYNKILSKNRTSSFEHKQDVINRRIIRNNITKEKAKEKAKLRRQNGDQYKKYCKTPELIENFYEAQKDNFKGWILHHRLENQFTVKELNDMGKYFDVSAEELIFLTTKEHCGRSDIHKGNRNKHWKNNKKL